LGHPPTAIVEKKSVKVQDQKGIQEERRRLEKKIFLYKIMKKIQKKI